MPPDSPRPEALIRAVHRRLATWVQPGDVALDATCGNGHDTVHLARLVGAHGQVHAIDIQPEAIAETRARLLSSNLAARVRLHQGDHACLPDLLPPKLRGQLQVAVFNLGYRPGSDHCIITRPTTTLMALKACTQWLSDNGAMSIMAYPGHPGGDLETHAVVRWSECLSERDWRVWWTCPPSKRRPAPRWAWITRATLDPIEVELGPKERQTLSL
ncbi:MAG: class I SAM-dependent methyltransferase [Pseudomonadota bacterium]|nr:class I SAM-dependent methyltransferase [Pseudomonadota bacterium]